jgi:hypothetical protein
LLFNFIGKSKATPPKGVCNVVRNLVNYIIPNFPNGTMNELVYQGSKKILAVLSLVNVYSLIFRIWMLGQSSSSRELLNHKAVALSSDSYRLNLCQRSAVGFHTEKYSLNTALRQAGVPDTYRDSSSARFYLLTKMMRLTSYTI